MLETFIRIHKKRKLVIYIRYLFRYIYEFEYWLHKTTIRARKRVQPIRTGENINITCSQNSGLQQNMYIGENCTQNISLQCSFLHQIIKLVFITILNISGSYQFLFSF